MCCPSTDIVNIPTLTIENGVVCGCLDMLCRFTERMADGIDAKGGVVHERQADADRENKRAERVPA